MKQVNSYKYHSTGQFRNAVKNIQNKAKFKGLDTEGNAIIDETAISPTLKYEGTVKLHGTNASIIIHNEDTISFNSKSQTLATVHRGEFVLNSDNAEFAQSMQRRKEVIQQLCIRAENLCYDMYDELRYPIKISGEWCGQGIQKGVGISFLSKKSLFVFGIKIQDEWFSSKEIFIKDLEEFGIFNIYDFPVETLDIDFSNPIYSQNKLVQLTEQVEEVCPVSKQLGITESLLGEGLVWKPVDFKFSTDSGNWFKTKGKKHSVSKVKSVASVCPEKLNSIKEFVEYAVTVNRLDQGIDEVGLDQQLVGKYIGWVNSDINKEEADVLEENNLTMKEIGKLTANKARQYYLDKLNSDL